jgi:hypothetical protein
MQKTEIILGKKLGKYVTKKEEEEEEEEDVKV